MVDADRPSTLHTHQRRGPCLRRCRRRQTPPSMSRHQTGDCPDEKRNHVTVGVHLDKVTYGCARWPKAPLLYEPDDTRDIERTSPVFRLDVRVCWTTSPDACSTPKASAPPGWAGHFILPVRVDSLIDSGNFLHPHAALMRHLHDASVPNGSDMMNATFEDVLQGVAYDSPRRPNSLSNLAPHSRQLTWTVASSSLIDCTSPQGTGDHSRTCSR